MAEAEREGDQDDELVTCEAACPRCRERRVDCLGIQDDESVKCGSCGLQYELPGAGQEGER